MNDTPPKPRRAPAFLALATLAAVLAPGELPVAPAPPARPWPERPLLGGSGGVFVVPPTIARMHVGPTSCPGCESLECKHHGRQNRKRARRAKRAGAT